MNIPARASDLEIANHGLRGLDIGDAHYAGGSRVDAPLSFRHKNRITIGDLQDLHVAILRPDLDVGCELDLTEAERDLLGDAMSTLAGDSDNPVYDRADHPDHHVRYLLEGLLRVAPLHEWLYYDKVGRAYGFTVENAYVVHRPTGRSFFLTGAIYTNPNRVLNDDDYAYAEGGDAVLGRPLGEAVALHLLGGE